VVGVFLLGSRWDFWIYDILRRECAIEIVYNIITHTFLFAFDYCISDPTEQERLLTSVISKLEVATSTDLAESTALAHALALRARASLERQEWSLASRDAQRATQKEFSKVATPETISVAYRVWADAEQASSGSSSTQNVISVLQQWYKAQPTYRTKLQREIQDLVDRSAAME
jgi:hypothetical protein